ncbi:MAG: hypothetical protein H6563_11570 [Lewinellaceae bacterium]|nr:hypothetical protein [Lewinellaceae bacterium]
MKTLNDTLKNKIETWISPLPEHLQTLVWEALRATENTNASFNPYANDFSELLMWHLSPAGRFFWSSVNQITDYFWKLEWKRLDDTPEARPEEAYVPELAA